MRSMNNYSEDILRENSIEVLFGQVLKRLRQERGLSQEELGFESGYHRTYVSLLERGKKNPSLKTVFQLAKALKMEPSQIIEAVQTLVVFKSNRQR